MTGLRWRTLWIGGLFYAGVCVALGALVHRNFYLGLVGLCVARPLFRELGLLADRDERQRLLSYRSSHIAFLTVMLIAGVIFVKTGFVEGGEPPFEVSVILLVGLLVKFAGLMMQSRARKMAGRAIAWVVGVAWLVFVLASHGLSLVSLIEGAPWLAVLAFALVGRRWPKVGGAGLGVIGLGTLYFFVLRSGQPIETRLLLTALIPAPLGLSAALLFAGDRDWREER